MSGPASPGSLASVTNLDSNALWTEARIVTDCNVCDLEDLWVASLIFTENGHHLYAFGISTLRHGEVHLLWDEA